MPDDTYLRYKRSEHNKPYCIEAKVKEIKNFTDFEVYDVVDIPENKDILPTQWVLVQKEDDHGNIITKGRLCIRGDLERNTHLIPTDSPTINKITLKILLTLAIAFGWSVRASDISRAFLQTEDLKRDIFVKPPSEAHIEKGKCWKLKKCCYGLIDAGRSFFLNHADKLKKLGMETLKLDPACFLYFKDNSKINSQARIPEGAIGCHVDDTICAGNSNLFDEVLEEMKNLFKYGSHKDLPFKYTGLNLKETTSGIVIDQKQYVEELEVPEIHKISHLSKTDVLDKEHQTLFRSLASKLNMLSITVRPDIAFEAKMLTSRYGKATKEDFQKAIRLVKKIKRESNYFFIPNIGKIDEWIIIGISDAATKKVNNLFSVSGQIVMLVNNKTNNASVLFWASKKIERVCNSSLAAETLALQKLFSTIHFVRNILNQMFGKRAAEIPGLALIDNQDLWSTIHHLKNCEDKRLLADIIQLKQDIAVDKIINEVRFVPGSNMLADCLTKPGRAAEALNQVLKTGKYEVPGGYEIRDSTKINVDTWQALIDAETEDFTETQDFKET